MPPNKSPYAYQRVTTPKGVEVMIILRYKMFGQKAALTVHTYPDGVCVYKAPARSNGMGMGRLKKLTDVFSTDEGDEILAKVGV